MVQRIRVELFDDLEDTTGDDVETVTFGLHGVHYEMELHKKNADALEKALAPFIAGARVSGKEDRRKRRLHSVPTAKGPDARAVRAWAATTGVEVNSSGRVPERIIALYLEATGGQEATG